MLTRPSACPAPSAASHVKPLLSVVVPSVNGEGSLLDCLASVFANAEPALGLDVIVVDRCGDAVRRAVHERYPDAVVVAVGNETSIPEMRALAFGRARADAVAVIEDHILVPADWARRLLAALEGHDVIGGTVDNAADECAVDRAAFLCEYSHLAAGTPHEIRTVTGNNVVYRRALLGRYAATIGAHRWEDHLHDAMARDGVRLAVRTDIQVRHKMHYRVGEYMSQRYLYARAYAGLRVREMGWLARAAFTVGAAALPVLLLGRIVGRVLAHPVHRRDLLPSLPLLLLFVTAWAAGEAVGYAAGPGDAMARVR